MEIDGLLDVNFDKLEEALNTEVEFFSKENQPYFRLKINDEVIENHLSSFKELFKGKNITLPIARVSISETSYYYYQDLWEETITFSTFTVKEYKRWEAAGCPPLTEVDFSDLAISLIKR